MASVVIDAGVALKAVLPNPLQVTCRALLRQLAEEEAELTAPGLWAYETTSVLTRAVHFQHLTPAEALSLLDWIRALEIRLVPADASQDHRAFAWTVRLQRAAAYDSYYLALAETQGSDLWTTDEKLVRAAGVPWVRSVSALVP